MKKTEKDVDVTLGPFAGDFVSPNGKVDRVKMAVGQILYIPVCSFVDCNLQLFTTFTGFEVRVLPKEVQDWPKHVVGHPLPSVVEIRSGQITFTPDGLRWQGTFVQKAELLRALGSVEICLDATRLTSTSFTHSLSLSLSLSFILFPLARSKGQIKRQQVIKELNHPFVSILFFSLSLSFSLPFFAVTASRSI